MMHTRWLVPRLAHLSKSSFRKFTFRLGQSRNELTAFSKYKSPSAEKSHISLLICTRMYFFADLDRKMNLVFAVIKPLVTSPSLVTTSRTCALQLQQCILAKILSEKKRRAFFQYIRSNCINPVSFSTYQIVQ